MNPNLMCIGKRMVFSPETSDLSMMFAVAIILVLSKVHFFSFPMLILRSGVPKAMNPEIFASRLLAKQELYRL